MNIKQQILPNCFRIINKCIQINIRILKIYEQFSILYTFQESSIIIRLHIFITPFLLWKEFIISTWRYENRLTLITSFSICFWIHFIWFSIELGIIEERIGKIDRSYCLLILKRITTLKYNELICLAAFIIISGFVKYLNRSTSIQNETLYNHMVLKLITYSVFEILSWNSRKTVERIPL